MYVTCATYIHTVHKLISYAKANINKLKYMTGSLTIKKKKESIFGIFISLASRLGAVYQVSSIKSTCLFLSSSSSLSSLSSLS